MAGKVFEFGFRIAAAIGADFKASFGAAGKEIAELNSKISENKKLVKMLDRAQKSGVITAESYANAMGYITPEMDALQEKQKNILDQQAKWAGLGSKSLGAFAKGAAFAGAGQALLGFTQHAIKFESSMADVKKVVDFDTPEQFRQMSKDVLDLSTKIPMTAEGLAQIVAAGGQSGIAKDELIGFAESAAKMGVAFDITADQAGDMMAKWRTAFKMGQTDVVALADKINFLGNTTAASAPLISDVVTRIGPLGAVGGVASGEIAALGASMVGSGINSEIAATGIKNMILSLVSGTGATKSQASAFAELGLNAVEMANYMQKDAKGAILTVLRSIQQIDKARQASVMAALFGKESLGAIAPLLSNLEGLEENFNKVADAAEYAGSMEAEFAARANTAENSLQLMNNRMEAAKTSIAQGLLPAITPLAESVGSLAMAVGNVASEYPGFTQAALTAGLAVTAFGAAGNFAKGIYYGGKWLIQGAKAINAFGGAAKVATVFTRGFALAQLAFNSILAACPIGWLIIGISALTVAGVALYRNWDKVKSFFTTIWDNPTAKLIMFNTGPIGWLIAAPVYVISHWDELAAYLNYFWDNPRAALFRFTSWVREELTGAVKWVEEKWEGIRNFLSQPIFGSVNITASGKEGQKVAQNAYGGIYGKGAFLTSFAERDGESAIPHTPNRRNVGLLAATNAIMGNPLGRGNITATFAPQITVQGGGSDTAAQIDTLMTQKLREFEEMLKRVAAQQRRLSYA